MKNRLFLLLILVPVILLLSKMSNLQAQTILDADGPGNTYELINNTLAPGNVVVENPECIHPEFGRHIAEVWDADLKKYVFEFYIHVTPDNDRCINFDRQRVEIKTYDQSPDSLKGVTGEIITYKWKFRLPIGFQPSSNFTHLHQIKAVDGAADEPIFTFTARKGTPNKLEVIHDNSTRLAVLDLSLFIGNWVEVSETIKVDSLHGTYSVIIKKVSDGSTILSYSNTNLMTIRYNNSFIRPKWGIYRSLLNAQDLRDEAVRFAGFSIKEGAISTAVISPLREIDSFTISPSKQGKQFVLNYSLKNDSMVKIALYSANGLMVKQILTEEFISKGNYHRYFDTSALAQGAYVVKLDSKFFSKTLKVIVGN